MVKISWSQCSAEAAVDCFTATPVRQISTDRTAEAAVCCPDFKFHCHGRRVHLFWLLSPLLSLSLFFYVIEVYFYVGHNTGLRT